MAEAVPRQFEIVRTAVRGSFATKIGLATEVHRYTQRMIREKRPSAFQISSEDQVFPMRARSIVPYVTVGQSIGLLDDSLEPTGPITKRTNLSGFVNHLRDVLPPYADQHGFSLNEIRDFILGYLGATTYPIEPITPRLLYIRLNPDLSQFVFDQCLAMLHELYSDVFRVHSVRSLLHRDALWGAG